MFVDDRSHDHRYFPGVNWCDRSSNAEKYYTWERV